MKFNSIIQELAVYDFRKSKEFYTKILGFSLEYEREEEGFAFFSLGETQLMVCQIGIGRDWLTGKFEKPLGRGINFQIRVDDLEKVLSSLKNNNVSLFMEPEEKWYRIGDYLAGNKQFLVQDPDGYLLRFFQDLGNKPLD